MPEMEKTGNAVSFCTTPGGNGHGHAANGLPSAALGERRMCKYARSSAGTLQDGLEGVKAGSRARGPSAPGAATNRQVAARLLLGNAASTPLIAVGPGLVSS